MRTTELKKINKKRKFVRNWRNGKDEIWNCGSDEQMQRELQIRE